MSYLRKTDRRLNSKLKFKEGSTRIMTLPIGTIIAYGGSFEDTTADRLKRYLQNDGWLVCDGTTVEKDYFFELYEVIGDRFGKVFVSPS